MTEPSGDHFTLSNWRNSTLFFPFIFGVVFVSLILLLAVAIREPTDFQFQIFRSVIALAGAGFAATLSGTLEVYIPFLRKGFVKATAGFGVFVILFFFSPASLVIDASKVNAKALIDEFLDGGSRINVSASKLEKRLLAPDLQAVFQKAAQPDEAILNQMDAALSSILSEKQYSDSYDTVFAYYRNVVDCTVNNNCDKNMICDFFFNYINGFRNTFCGKIMDHDKMTADISAEIFDRFLVDECRVNFLNRYIRFDNRSFEGTCIPVQCWAKNKSPPYPCQVRQQIKLGIFVPS